MGMDKLKFKRGTGPVDLSEDFFYMITEGGWCAPEKFLEEEDAQRVRDAINLILAYEEEGIEGGYFEEC
jgi:hypothetical protein